MGHCGGRLAWVGTGKAPGDLTRCLEAVVSAWYDKCARAAAKIVEQVVCYSIDNRVCWAATIADVSW